MPIDPVHFSDLAARDPREIIQRTHADWDSRIREYRIRIWGCNYWVDAQNGRIRTENEGKRILPDYMDLLIVHYLMSAQNPGPANEWVSEKDIPGGSAFFRGPHTLPTHDIARVFGEDMEGFAVACTRLGGRPLAMADAAFVFDITPQIPVAVLLWQGDEDFSADAGLLFDKTIARHLALDIIYALAVLVCKTICSVRKTD